MTTVVNRLQPHIFRVQIFVSRPGEIVDGSIQFPCFSRCFTQLVAAFPQPLFALFIISKSLINGKSIGVASPLPQLFGMGIAGGQQSFGGIFIIAQFFKNGGSLQIRALHFQLAGIGIRAHIGSEEPSRRG